MNNRMRKYGYTALILMWAAVFTGCSQSTSSDSDESANESTQDDGRPRHVPAGYEQIHPEGVYVKYSARGKGDVLDTGDVAVFHFLGKRVDIDKKFQNSYEVGRPRHGEIGQKQMMPALNYILSGARIGDEFKMYVAPEMGFGDRIINKVPAGKHLYLEVQVLGKKNPKPAFDVSEFSPERILLDMEFYRIKKTNKPKPKEGQEVVIHYNAYYKDSGDKFDSSHDRGYPIVFEILSGEVIQGLDATARSMREGEKGRVIIPSEYGYGSSGRNKVPGGKDLVFDLHLIEVREPAE